MTTKDTDTHNTPPADQPLALRLSEGLGAWLPIATAPEGRLIVVGWLDGEDDEHPERHDFDWLEDGCWTRYADHVEYAYMVAPRGSRMPPQRAPYTHWLDLPAIPKAPNVISPASAGTLLKK
jgi:hypothetical protein